jgi:hypothetical protein
MTVEDNKTTQEQAAELPADIGLILEAIEKEPVPERLLTLAMELQDALSKRRAAEQASQASAAMRRSPEL